MPAEFKPRLPGDMLSQMAIAITDPRLVANVTSHPNWGGSLAGTDSHRVLLRKLRDGNPDTRWAVEQFPVADIQDRVLETYWEKGPSNGNKYPEPPMWSFNTAQSTLQLAAVAGFADVTLAYRYAMEINKKNGGSDDFSPIIGLGMMWKPGMGIPIPPTLYGALLTNKLHYVVVGAGDPSQMPEILNNLVQHKDVTIKADVKGGSPVDVKFNPRRLMGYGDSEQPPELVRPFFIAKVASPGVAKALYENPRTRQDATAYEDPVEAGGHVMSPRKPYLRMRDRNPIYEDPDHLPVKEIQDVHPEAPFYLAGGYGNPEGYEFTRSIGAGRKIGTLFALATDSGMALPFKKQTLAQNAAGSLDVVPDGWGSPTLIPFKVANVKGTLADPDIYDTRTRRRCAAGGLRTPAQNEAGKTAWLCRGEPEDIYVSKGGRPVDTRCVFDLCQALFATAGLAQRYADGYQEHGVVTLGNPKDIRRISPEGKFYSSHDVIAFAEGKLPNAG